MAIPAMLPAIRRERRPERTYAKVLNLTSNLIQGAERIRAFNLNKTM